MKGCLLAVVVIGILAAIAIPNLMRARHQFKEASARTSISTLNSAMSTFHAQYHRYPASIEELGPPDASVSNATRAGLVPADLASGISSNYYFTVQGGPDVYTINAEPVNFGQDGKRTFYSDESRKIHQHEGREPASASSPAI